MDLQRIRRPLTCLTLSLAAIVACGPAEQAASLDPRTAVVLPPTDHQAVLGEMRTMLGSVNGVLEGLARGDTGLVRSAALASGVGPAMDPTVASRLPREFLRLGMGTHQQFDSLAADVGHEGWQDSVVTRLAQLTGNCVSCHAVYRLEPR